MKNRPLKRLFLNKFVLILTTIFSICYICEVYLYQLSKYNFNKLECVDENLCLRILLVADPQLIGLHNEIIHPLTGLAIFDIDRFLYKTYSMAFDFINPHVIIFLGDLFDEGSSSTQREFDSYNARFHKIYGYPSKTVQHIYLPGDNDIGGEGYDIITQKKILRFYNAFNQSNTFHIRNVTFYKYNRLIYSLIEPTQNLNEINVGLSHVPLLKYYDSYGQKMIKTTNPHVIFSGHEHSASLVNIKREDHVRKKFDFNPTDNKVYKYSLSDFETYEFIVPTVSYRMGTDKIGHGYAIIEGNQLLFTVLWSPVRFPLLILLGVLLFVGGIYSIFIILCNCIKKRPRKYVLLPI